MKKSITIQAIRAANKNYFARGQAEFFGDVFYKVLHGKQTKRAYMVRYTAMWSDMFTGRKTYCWRVNEVNQDTLEIDSLVDDIFDTENEVKEWMQTH